MNRTHLIAVLAGACVVGTLAGLTAHAATSAPRASCNAPSYDGTNFSLHCVVPRVTTAVTKTATTTVTHTVTVTARPPTTTPPRSTTTPPPPPTTTSPPQSGSFAPGEDMHAANTGYAGDRLTAANLTPVSGSVTYDSTYNGQTISGKAYSGTVTISGSNITVKDCSETYQGSNAFGLVISGTNDTIDHCTVTSPSGQEMYEPTFINPGTTGARLTYNDISRGENLNTTYGNNVTIANNYMHDSCNCGDPDGIELYGGTNVTIQNNRIDYDGLYEAPINIAPYNSYKVNGAYIKGNLLDHGQSVILVDNQNTSCGTGAGPASGNCLNDVVVEDNAMGGHQCPSSNPQCFSIYHPDLNQQGRSFTQTDAAEAANPNAIEWPTSGTNVNRWEESSDLIPKNDGQIVVP